MSACRLAPPWVFRIYTETYDRCNHTTVPAQITVSCAYGETSQATVVEDCAAPRWWLCFESGDLFGTTYIGGANNPENTGNAHRLRCFVNVYPQRALRGSSPFKHGHEWKCGSNVILFKPVPGHHDSNHLNANLKIVFRFRNRHRRCLFEDGYGPGARGCLQGRRQGDPPSTFRPWEECDN